MTQNIKNRIILCLDWFGDKFEYDEVIWAILYIIYQNRLGV